MVGRLCFVLALCFALVALPEVTFAGGGVAVAVPSCQVQNVQVQAVQAYAPVAVAAPVQVAVPLYAQQQVVQLQAVQQHQVAVQSVKVQRVQVVQANHHAVRVQVRNQPRTALGAAIQAFRDQRFGR